MKTDNSQVLQKPKFEISQEEILRYAQLCFAGAEQREEKFKSYLKLYYEGTDSFAPFSLKRLFGEINTILSLIYTPESLVLDYVCDRQLNDVEQKLIEALIQEVYNNFLVYERLDVEIEEAILHSLIFGYVPIKVFWHETGVLYREIYPGHFGVLYESLPLDDRQQVICHRSFMTKEKIKFLYGVDYDSQKELIEKPKKGEKKLSIIGLTPTAISAATQVDLSSETWKAYDAGTLVEIRELYLNEYYRTGVDQWHKFVIIPELNLVVDHMPLKILRHPFFVLTPYPAYGSIHGVSIIEMIKEIQNKRNELLEQIDQVTNLRTAPPIVIRGANISPDALKEEIRQLYTPGGMLVVQDANAEWQAYPPATGLQELYALLDYWNDQLKYVTGLYEVVLGESRVKASKGLQLLATFATSIFRRIARRIEVLLEDIFWYTAKLYQIYSDKEIIIDGKPYRYSYFPYEFRINIKAHSSSPIDLQRIEQYFLLLYRHGDLPADVLFDFANLPFKQRFQKFQEQKAKAFMLKEQLEKEKEEKK